ncbi:prenyltransferase [Actinocrinis puniceicyclus]|uniref:Prenyltransferase n=1 Tax=Actinocrinis puniceicyclus TaxID=977794 RepID=A0A8J7WRU2_9ACTN|nr:prenyltransferase [Actinocrinis puniceicyclus]MBS2965292.1 prenyltransferase [Actinocrinis puniceicyclus]
MTAAHLAAAGVLDVPRAARTVAGIKALQRRDGAVPWFAGGKLDPWDHVESAMALDAAGEHEAARRAYLWLARTQNSDGSWYAGYADTPEGVSAAAVTDRTLETNFTAYCAVGIYHHYLATADRRLLRQLWPTVAAAIEFVLRQQRSDGAIRWQPGGDEALLSGCSSMYQALRCAVAAATALGEDQPGWELAFSRLGHALAAHPERFAPKERYSMDWYYPVLGTVLRGGAGHRRIDEGWDRFVVPGFGVRCVDDHPWVTGGESSELAIALWALGREAQARAVLADVGAHLRDEADGMYWTGYVYADRAVWPEEKTSWTAGSLLLALAALGGEPATRTVFGGEALPAPLPVECAAEPCGSTR